MEIEAVAVLLEEDDAVPSPVNTRPEYLAPVVEKLAANHALELSLS